VIVIICGATAYSCVQCVHAVSTRMLSARKHVVYADVLLFGSVLSHELLSHISSVVTDTS
jgi:hypothetical protein